MSVSRRNISKHNIKNAFKQDGIKGVLKLFEAEILFYEDSKFVKKVTDYVSSEEFGKLSKFLQKP